MSHGIFVIANDIPGVNSLIRNNYSGILIKDNRSEAFINEIIKLSANRKLLYKYSKACLSTVKKFDRVNFLKFYTKFLYSIKKIK